MVRYAEFFVANEVPCKPRLFQCTDRAGMGLRVEEIVDFCQVCTAISQSMLISCFPCTMRALRCTLGFYLHFD